MRVLQGIILSLLVHLLFVWGSQYAPLLAKKSQTQPITVEIQESQNETKSSQPKENRQIVREALVPDKMKAIESDDPLKFLSAQSQRVKEQTRAANSGMTKNRQLLDPLRPLPQKPTKQSAESKTDFSGNLQAFSPQYRKTPSISQDLKMDPGLSTLGEALPQEVSVGSFTALNTDRYLYYSFFARIEELIRFRWENSIRNAIDSAPAENFRTNVSGLWNTQLEIWLKPTGEFHSAHLMKESGFRAFDQSAIQAFVQAQLFPNPPREMVETDGLIHLRYVFQVRYEPKVLVRSRE